MCRRSILFLWLSILLLAPVEAYAFDGKRKGFVIGGNLGLGVSTFVERIEQAGMDPVDAEREWQAGLGTGIRIGGAFNEQWMLYWIEQIAWFRTDAITGSDVTFANALSGVGFSFYRDPDHFSTYVAFGAGMSTLGAPFDNNVDTLRGLGLYGAFGYEFRTHWSVEVSALWGRPNKDDMGTELTVRVLSVMVMITGLAY